MKITRVAVVGLFDLFNHEFSLHTKERVTILFGPNGYGKTTILRLIEAISTGNLTLIGSVPFESISLMFDTGTTLSVIKTKSEKQSVRCVFQVSAGDKPKDVREWNTDEVKSSLASAIQHRYPSLRQIDSDLWEDTADGEIIPTAEVCRRLEIPHGSDSDSEIGRWLKGQMSEVNVRFIEAQRLLKSSPRPFRARNRFGRVTHSVEFTSVSNYSKQLANRIQATLGEYAERSGRLDQSFPERLLSAFQVEGPFVSDEELAQHLVDVDEKRLRLRNAGLLEKEDDVVQLPSKVKGEVKKVLGVYLADVTEKLAVFDEILNRIELLREILDEHFAVTLKKVEVSRDSGLSFRTSAGQSLAAAALSSGEQHILILVYELLFAEKRDSLILIDEPEISLHISWQLSFLDDLQKIAQFNQNDILIATHSPQIIGDRTDLTVELTTPDREAAWS